MTDIEFYLRLTNNPCEGCSAYEEIGHCGTWAENCFIHDLLIDMDEFLEEMGWDKDDLVDYIIYKDTKEPEFLMDIEEIENYISNIEDICDDYYGNLY